MNRGGVVQVDWPYNDLTGSKSRPAVVVQADFLNGIIDDTVLVQITSSQSGILNTEVQIDPTMETWSDLTKMCFARCTNFLTLDETLVQRTIGVLSAGTMQKIDACLKAVLGLP